MVRCGGRYAFYGQLAVKTPGQGPGYEQTESRTGLDLPFRHLGGPATVEDVGYIAVRYTRTVIPHTDEELGRVIGDPELHVPGREPDRVIDQVRNHMLDGRGVGVYDTELGRLRPPGDLLL